MPPSARKRAGSAAASAATVFLPGDAAAPPSLDVSAPPRRDHAVIANKSGFPADLLAEGGSPTNYRPLYSPTREYFNGDFAGAARLPGWVWWWMLVSAVLVLFDSLYVLSTLPGSTSGLGALLPKVVRDLWTWYGESDTQYSAESITANQSSGWIPTQTKFNVVEVAAQLAFLFVLRRNGASALLAALVAQVCTLYKTLIYMSIIWHAADPVEMVPLLSCYPFGMAARSASAAAHVAAAIAKDSCAVQFFKFQFNFWWIAVPLCVIWACWHRAAAALSK
jgi:hypothetical protein